MRQMYQIMTSSRNNYVLQCVDLDDPSDFKTIAYYPDTDITGMPDIKIVVHEYLSHEYGDDYKRDVFDSIDTYIDDAGGCRIEATDLEGGILRFWLQHLL